MSLNEFSHAFIVASFYKALKDAYGDRGINVFRFAATKYGEERGKRMAMRVLADDRQLDFRAYKEYSEWSNTKDCIDTIGGNISENLKFSPDYEYRITVCPWAYQFEKMGLKECGAVYCGIIDKAIVRGFNPELVFEVPTNLNINDHCIQIMRGADFDSSNLPKGDISRQKDFTYHCAHAYYTFLDCCIAILGPEGGKIGDTVYDNFVNEYGNEAFSEMEQLSVNDFNYIF